MREAAQRSSLGTNGVRKYFRNKNPDYRALGKCKKSNKPDQVNNNILIGRASTPERISCESEKDDHTDGTCNQECLSAHFINNGHSQEGKKQVGTSDKHRLKIGR